MTETKLQKLSRQFNAGEIDKFDFYGDTMNYSAAQVAEAAGIAIEVVKDRRRYMRQLARQTKPARTTTIQITQESAAHLNEVSDAMRRIFPDIFAATAPTKDAIVGFLAGHFLAGLTDNDIDMLRTAWAERQAARN